MDRSLNLVGKSFGQLTVIKRSGRNSIGAIWECTCSCGKTTLAETYPLRSGIRTSCGCKRSGSGNKCAIWKGYGDIPGDYWSRIKKGALTREIPFDVSIAEAWDMFSKQGGRCAISGVPIVFGGRATKTPYTASLDRIDSSLGYVPENLQWVHKDVNIMKSDHTSSAFLNWIKIIYEHNNP